MLAPKMLTGFIVCFCLKMSFAAVTVGTCQTDKHPYMTISAAIAAASAGDVVNVCPGTYAEQVEIDKPLILRGINGGATIVSPSTGLNELPSGSQVFPQVFVNNAGGEVKLTGLNVNGTDALFYLDGNVLDSYACPTSAIEFFVGIYFLNTPGIVENMTVSGQFATSLTGGDQGPQLIPNCGSGVEFNGSGRAVVRNSSISDVGIYGIYSNGDLVAEHNLVSVGYGPYGVGIASISGLIRDNTVTGSLYFYETTGILGGASVNNNVVQSAIYGIRGANHVRDNTLTNNAISVSKISDVSGNQISAPSIYYDPGCFNYGCGDSLPFGPPFPTIGIDLGCEDGGRVRGNVINGVGIGFANVEAGVRISPTNVLSNVTTTSTRCSQ
jgi:hypothetical protein